MNLATEPASCLSLSLDLPSFDSNTSAWLGRSLARLNSVRERFNVPVTWIWSGELPTTKNDFAPLGDSTNDLGWKIPTSQEARLAYRTRMIAMLKQWSGTLKGTGLQLRMVIVNESKTMIPYDAFVNHGVVSARHSTCTSHNKNNSVMQPQRAQTGLWQVPVHAELHLNGGWLTMAREMRQINHLPKMIAANRGAHFHLRVVLDTNSEAGSRVMGQWERILHYVDSLRQQGVEVDLAANLLQTQSIQIRRSADSILRAA